MKPTPLPASPGENLYWEKQAADRLGLSRTKLRELRKAHLAPEVDWQFRSNAVVLTASGLEKIQAVLAATGPSAAISAAPAPSVPSPAFLTPPPADATRGLSAVLSRVIPSGPPPSRKFMVVDKPLYRVDRPQKKVLVCAEVPDDAKQVPSWDLYTTVRATLRLGQHRNIQVRDNTNFVPGMVLEAVCIGQGMWQYVGRLPRRSGRW